MTQSKDSKNVNGTEETLFLEGENLKAQIEASAPKYKYDIIRELGKGGFAWVYLVRNLDLDRLEAIKILNMPPGSEEDTVERFVKEARIAANFNHQNIITIFEVKKDGDWSQFKVEDRIRERHNEPFTYFTMSFVEGNTATNMIRAQRKLSQKQAIKIAYDTCQALEYAHGKGVIHRDIKPDNILVDRKGNGIVMDFGIAKAANQTRLTAAGTFMGTARYVSPEQALGQEIDGRSDLYSLGIALYEMVTGRVPFDSEAWMTVLYQHINQVPDPPEKFSADIDRDLQRIILKMLEKKPDQRFQSAGECGNVLVKLYQKLGGDDLSTEAMDRIGTRQDLMQPSATDVTRVVGKTPPVRSTRPTEQAAEAASQSGSKMGLWMGLAVAVLAILGLSWFLTRPKPVEPEPDPVPLVLNEGRVLVTAFPKASISQVVKVEGNQRETIDAPQGQTPMWLDLPEGEYELVLAYEGNYEKAFTLIRENEPARVHVEFTVDPNQFLLDDLP